MWKIKSSLPVLSVVLVYLKENIISTFKSVSTPPEAMDDFQMERSTKFELRDSLHQSRRGFYVRFSRCNCLNSWLKWESYHICRPWYIFLRVFGISVNETSCSIYNLSTKNHYNKGTLNYFQDVKSVFSLIFQVAGFWPTQVRNHIPESLALTFMHSFIKNFL